MQKNKGDAFLFPRRNRIVAGLCDAVVVIESGLKGGSLITARLAADYQREVFALPGRPSDVKSQGCNALIKQHRAALFESGDEIAAHMGWERPTVVSPERTTAARTKKPPTVLTAAEATLLHHINSSESPSIDQLKAWTETKPQDLAAALINLELGGLIVSLPGNRYQSV
jgi:DNA processing protein